MIQVRRIVQLLFLFLFFYLLIQARLDVESLDDPSYRTASPIPVDLFFRADPLAAVSVAAATRELPPAHFLLAFFVLFLAIFLGRYFCGWVCPLGTLLDVSARVIKPSRKEKKYASKYINHRLKYYILALIIVVALLGINLLGYIDPITITWRTFSYSILPYSDWVVKSSLAPLYSVPVVNRVSEPIYQYLYLESQVLNVETRYYQWAFLYLGIFVVIIGLNRVTRRFWCKYLCPLGALHALVGWIGLVKRRVDDKCIECGLCEKSCRMDAIREPAKIFDYRECVQCLECRKICPTDAIRFSASGGPKKARGEAVNTKIDLTRRGLLTSAGLSIIALPLLSAGKERLNINEFILRPPGAEEEDTFLEKCIKCGECMKVCPQNALQPALLETGFEGLWTPLLVPRIGYCEHDCNLCTTVCPTGAIKELTLEEKKKWKMGTSYFDRNRCIPWNEGVNCSVCEEACPVSPKAIELEERGGGSGGRGQGKNGRGGGFRSGWDREERPGLKKPFLIPDRCVGCGTCENVCPVEGASAIRVTSRMETRSAAGFSEAAIL